MIRVKNFVAIRSVTVRMDLAKACVCPAESEDS